MLAQLAIAQGNFTDQFTVLHKFLKGSNLDYLILKSCNEDLEKLLGLDNSNTKLLDNPYFYRLFKKELVKEEDILYSNKSLFEENQKFKDYNLKGKLPEFKAKLIALNSMKSRDENKTFMVVSIPLETPDGKYQIFMSYKGSNSKYSPYADDSGINLLHLAKKGINGNWQVVRSIDIGLL